MPSWHGQGQLYLADKYEWLASHPEHFTSKKEAAGML